MVFTALKRKAFGTRSSPFSWTGKSSPHASEVESDPESLVHIDCHPGSDVSLTSEDEEFVPVKVSSLQQLLYVEFTNISVGHAHSRALGVLHQHVGNNKHLV